MSKYYKSFEELKLAITFADGEPVDLIDDDKDATEDYSRRSRFGRNPENNVIEYQRRAHDHTNFDDFCVIIIGCTCKKS